MGGDAVVFGLGEEEHDEDAEGNELDEPVIQLYSRLGLEADVGHVRWSCRGDCWSIIIIRYSRQRGILAVDGDHQVLLSLE